ncbi:MAG: carbamoylphosphate synthase large subunit [Coprobacillus sp.]
MNVVFISPHFPLYFYNFCQRLKDRGVNVLGIGDASYDSISEETKASLTEYYMVNNLEDYDEVYKACGYFTWHYGHIDWIESQNEYWLELEATLRNDFHVETGTVIQNLAPMKYKSKMKDVYKAIGITCARYRFVDDYQATKAFANSVGYPVIVKPDNGVGASSTYKLKSDEELDYFFSTKNPHIHFIIEEMVPGHVETFDGITDKDKNILIATSHVMLNSIMDNVNEASDTAFYSQPIEGLDIYDIGKKAVEAFDTRSRFFHFEFFRLDEDKEGLGKQGDLVGLEVNMRAPGAYMPDMMNMAYNVDVYTIWADMLKYNKCYYDYKRENWVAYTGRRDGFGYAHNYDDIRNTYGNNIGLEADVPEVLSAAMGNHVFIMTAKTKEELFEMIRYILKREDGTEWM